MKYIKVTWHHSFPDEPVLLYSELDDEHWEIRKVEIFADGKIGYAGQGRASGTTRLSIEPLPSLEEIAEQSEFEPTVIDGAEFEAVWAKANK